MEAFKSTFGVNVQSRTFQTLFDQLNTEFFSDIEKRKKHIAASPWFSMAIGFLIIANSIITGIEVDNSRGETLQDRLGFFILDFFFLLAFLVEMLICQHHLGWDYFGDPWNVFDFSLVVLNCTDIVISINAQGAAGLKVASILRVLRLFRVVRVIRGQHMFNGLWQVIQGLLDSLRSLFWVAILLLLVIYCLAVALTTFAGSDAYVRDRWLQSQQYLGNPWRSMWTVLQIITLDNWATDIARPLNQFSPGSLVLVFLGIMICTFGIANLIIAVMVERLQTIVEEHTQSSNKALEETEQELLASLREEFTAADVDGNDQLNLDAFKNLIRTPTVSFKLRCLGIHADEAEELFHLIDADKSESISLEEFKGGLKKMSGSANGEDLVTLICFTQRQRCRAADFAERVRALNEKADMIQARLNNIGRGITGEIIGRSVAEARDQAVWQQAGRRKKVITTMDKNRHIEFPALKANNARYGILY